MIRKFFFILLFPFFLCQTVFSDEEVPLPEKEAPTSLFSSKIGDADVDFLLSGFWKVGLTGGFGMSWDSTGSGIVNTPFAGFSGPPVFSQEPDITLSFWLMNQYFFEMSFIDNYALNTILFGYNAPDENDFLQEVRIGNTDIGQGTYSLLNIPEASTDSLGAMALFKGPNSEHQIMIRFDPAQKSEKSFKGSYGIQETRIPLPKYMKGSFFILPDKNVEDLRVYIEDSTNHYRLATADDAVISAEEGYVFFRNPQNTVIAVHYTKNGATVGDASLGKDALAADSGEEIDISGTADFNFGVSSYLGMNLGTLQTSINSETALIIYQPGQVSPFQMLSIYPLSFNVPEDGTPFDVLLVDKNLSTGEKTTFQKGPVEKTIMFTRSNDNSLRNPANRYPFADKAGSGTQLYGPESLLSGSPPDRELLVEQYEKVSAYKLGDNVLEGSVEMTVNGTADNRFTFNSKTGTASLLFIPAADDRIDFFYRTKSSGGGGDFLAEIGNHFDISDSLSAEIGAGIRWNISGDSYTEKKDEAPGSILASGGITYQGKNLQTEINGGINFYSPDTTGTFRLLGMDTAGIPVPVTENWLYPASAPVDSSIPGFPLIQSDRGELIYKDYHLYDSFGGSVLMNYNWTLPSAQEYSYTNDGRTGPYAAGSNNEIEGNVAVFDYALGSNQWTGGRIPLVLGSKGLDLSGVQGITLKMKLLDAAGTVQTYIRIGHLGEDLDGDNILDKETASFEKGFTFNPEYNGQTLSMKVGSSADGKSGNNQIDSEDLDGNGVLDPENDNTSVTLPGPIYSEPASPWTTITLTLTPDEREKLHNATGFEIIIKDTGSSSSGRLLVGDITLNGTSFITSPSSGQNSTEEDVNETVSGQPGTTIESDFPEVANTFSVSGQPQNIGKFTWDAAGTWSAETFTQPADLSAYRKLVFYMKTPVAEPNGDLDGKGHSTSVSFLDSGGKGLKFYFTPAASSSWQKYVFDYTERTLTVNGTVQSAVITEDDTAAENVNNFILSADCTSAGTLYLDEIHLEDSVFGVSGGITTRFSYSRPGVLLAAGGSPVLSNFSFSNLSSIAGNNFGTGFTTPQDSDVYTSSTMAVTLFSAQLSGTLDIRKEAASVYYSPGWEIRLPLFKGKGSLTDSYNEFNGSNTQSINRANTLTVPIGISLLSLSAQSEYQDESLDQEWNTGWKIAGNIFDIDTSLNLGITAPANPYSGENLSRRIITSFGLMLPFPVPDPQRNVSFKIDQTTQFKNSAVHLQEKITAETTGTTDRKTASSQFFILETPIVFNSDTTEEWYLTPSYSRSLTMKRSPVSDTSFFSDADTALNSIASQTYYFTSIPFYELFMDNSPPFSSESSGFDVLTYKPEFSLSFQRRGKNEPVDLILPSTARLSLSRTRTREWETLTDTKYISLDIGSNVSNLYGKLGSHPFFTWYQTEEYTSKTGIETSFPLFQEASVSLYTEQYLNFIIKKDQSLSFETNLSLKWFPFTTHGTIITSYNWLVPVEKKVKIPVIDPEGSEKTFFMNKENFTVRYNSTETTQETGITYTLHHSTNFIIGEKGSISASAGVGFSKKKISRNNTSLSYFQIGFEGGIQAQLNF